jgi:hypothetical protein
VLDRIRVPWPAAIMRAVKGGGMGLGGYRRMAHDISSGEHWGVV